MFGDEKERWRELCEQAANEQDPAKLMALVAEIDRILENKRASPAIERRSTNPPGKESRGNRSGQG